MSAGTLTRPQPPAIKKGLNRPFLLGLKVRIKELAFEAKTIRKEELKTKQRYRSCYVAGKEEWGDEHRSDFVNLHHHRIDYVRPAARETQLAYAYLRGKAYRQIEPTCHEEPNWGQVKRLVAKFGSARWAEGVEAWAAAE